MSTSKFAAPEVDRLIRSYEHGIMNPEQPSRALMAATEPLFKALADLAPCKANDEAKILWISVPRGELSDFGDFEEYQDEDIQTPTDFEKLQGDDE